MKLTEDAKKYIAKKGGNIYIKYHNIQNCCIDANFTPEIAIGMPKNKDRYYLVSFGSANVYIDRIIYNTEDLTIDTKNILGIKYLVIDGWKTF